MCVLFKKTKTPPLVQLSFPLPNTFGKSLNKKGNNRDTRM